MDGEQAGSRQASEQAGLPPKGSQGRDRGGSRHNAPADRPASG